jgi:DNA-binding SARP family transcriptional activator/tetratricopeptide (TPR) repeat protein
VRGGGTVRVRLLGPVDVEVDGEIRPVRGMRRRAALAVLALHAGDIVGVDRIMDAVWGANAPPTAPGTLQSHLSHLRRVLGDRDAIAASAPGYVLATDTDLLAAERLVAKARLAADPASTAALLRAALALWRGRPLQDAAGRGVLVEQAERLVELHVQITQELIEARLALGEHAGVLPDLEQLAAGRPYDEQLHAQLMLALYRAGRQADALAVGQRLRRALREELGIDAGAAVREREAAILRQDLALDHHRDHHPGHRDRAADEHVRTPRQLPPTFAAFTGRDSELAALDGLLDTYDTVGVVSGTPGVGKTALAVHWAQRTGDRFPDGQLYANLRGFDPAAPPLPPTEVLRAFLHVLGTPLERVPAELSAQLALYRGLLAGRRVLVLLDNARDADQVRPLLPGTGGCLVLVTSRNPLAALVAEGAATLPLDLPSEPEAVRLLASRLGTGRVAAEPEAVTRLVARCARLPLALAVVAARAAQTPDFPLAVLADGLDAAAGLDALDGGDPATSVRTVFSWSYDAMGADAARLFRLLGLHPAPALSLPAAAALAGLGAAETGELLGELAAARLVSEVAPGRYSCHDLLREYAAELADTLDPPARRQAALERMLDHYLHAAAGAARALYPNQVRDGLIPATPAGTGGDPRDWFGAQLPVLLSCLELAAAAGMERYTWQLAWSLVAALDDQGRWADVVRTQELAFPAALRLGQRHAQEEAHRRLAWANLGLGRLSRAREHADTALRLGEELGDPRAQGGTRRALGAWYRAQGDPRRALEQDVAAVALFRAAGFRAGEANALNMVGWDHAQLGEYGHALRYCTRAMELDRELKPDAMPGHTLDSLGYIHLRLGQHDAAIGWYEQAVQAFGVWPDTADLAEALLGLGDAHDGAGHRAQAQATWERALGVYTRLAHPDATRAHSRLGTAQRIRLVR